MMRDREEQIEAELFKVYRWIPVNWKEFDSWRDDPSFLKEKGPSLGRPFFLRRDYNKETLIKGESYET
jgi:hypothetical protein